MSTSINSLGVTFPDTTTQTTAATSAFATGTVVLFYQSAAPTGWTQVTSLDDYALRLVSGTGGTTGGTTAYSTVFANQTVSTTVSGTSGATTLSTAQIASHNHTVTFNGSGEGYTVSGIGGVALGDPAVYTSSSTGSGGSHTHSFSGSGTSSAVTLNVRYANIIICSKN